MAQEEALRFNEGKADIGQILEFGSALEKLAKVMSQGATKYTPKNWLKGGKPDEEYINSAMRHMMAFVEGEEFDADNGTHHIAHAAWNMLALLRLNYDDLPTLDDDFDQEAFVKKYTEPTIDWVRPDETNSPEIDDADLFPAEHYSVGVDAAEDGDETAIVLVKYQPLKVTEEDKVLLDIPETSPEAMQAALDYYAPYSLVGRYVKTPEGHHVKIMRHDKVLRRMLVRHTGGREALVSDYDYRHISWL